MLSQADDTTTECIVLGVPLSPLKLRYFLRDALPTFIREPGPLQERLKLTAVEVSGVHRFAHGVGEHEVVILPARPGL